MIGPDYFCARVLQLRSDPELEVRLQKLLLSRLATQHKVTSPPLYVAIQWGLLKRGRYRSCIMLSRSKLVSTLTTEKNTSIAFSYRVRDELVIK